MTPWRPSLMAVEAAVAAWVGSTEISKSDRQRWSSAMRRAVRAAWRVVRGKG